jgi:hypothetical protein
MLAILIGILGVIVSGLMGLLVCSNFESPSTTHRQAFFARGGALTKKTNYILLNHLNEPNISSIIYFELFNKYKKTMKSVDPKFDKFVIDSKASDHAIGYNAIDNPYTIDEKVDDYVILHDAKAGVVLIRYTVPDEPSQIKFSVRFTNKKALDDWKNNKSFVDNKTKLDLDKHIKELSKTDTFKQAGRDQTSLFDFYAVHTLDKDSILNTKHWYIAPKLDGTTYALVTYKQKIYAINKSYCECITGITGEFLDNDMILLCERLPNDEFHIFDILYYGDKYYGADAFYARYNYMNNTLKHTISNAGVPGMYLQEYCNVHPRNNSYKKCLTDIKERRVDLNTRGIGTDGFIFQPAGSRYYKEPVFKWKSHKELSIDLMCKDKRLYIAEKGQLIPMDKFLMTANKLLSTNVDIKLEKSTGVDRPSLTILEYTFDQDLKTQAYTLKFGRLRDDKFKPNSITVLEKMVYHLDINMEFDDINGETGFLLRSYMRSFQDSTLIPKIAERTTLYDLGAGDGRMVKIWKKKNLNVYASEPFKPSFEKLKIKVPKSFMLMGEDPKIKKVIKAGTMDYVYMSYNLHFFFKSEQTLKGLITNLQYLTKVGSYVIGISLDGEKVREKLSELNSNNTEIKEAAQSILDNKSFVISQKKTSKPQTGYGQAIEITMKNKTGLVKSQTEYLTDFDLFTKKMEVIGFKLEETGFVPEHETLSDANNWFASSTRFWRFLRVS